MNTKTTQPKNFTLNNKKSIRDKIETLYKKFENRKNKKLQIEKKQLEKINKGNIKSIKNSGKENLQLQNKIKRVEDKADYDKNIKKIKPKIIFLISLVLILIVVCTFLYFFKFHGSLSNINDDWADFGSYMSGTVGVLVAIISLVITGFIALIAFSVNKKLGYANRLTMHNLFIQENRFNSFNRFVDRQNKFIDAQMKVINQPLAQEALYGNYYIYLKSFSINYKILFPSIENDIEKLLKNIYSRWKKPNNLNASYYSLSDEFSENLQYWIKLIIE